MAIKNFLFILSASFALISCSGLRTRDQMDLPRPGSGMGQREVPVATPVVNPPSSSAELPQAPVETPKASPLSANPKVGLILGPGAARSFAHIGVLQALSKSRIQVTQIVGIEMGALIAAMYAKKAQMYDVEWQMSKFKDISEIGPFMQKQFQGLRSEDLKIPFSCPAYSLPKSQTYMMNKGPITQMLPYCLSAPPFLKPYAQNVAAVHDLKGVVDSLRAKGIQYVIYVHVLGTKDGVLTGKLEDSDNIHWNMVSAQLLKQTQGLSGLDYVLNVPISEYDLKSWDKVRELTQKGLEAGSPAFDKITTVLGL